MMMTTNNTETTQHAGPSAVRSLPFTKMQGLGNDYVYVEELEAPLQNAPELARQISDRHFGIGSDGLVLIGRSKIADFRMRIFNADGSEAEMCGNASRCVGKYLFEKGLAQHSEIQLETLAGIRLLHLSTEHGAVTEVSVDMGSPQLVPADIPMLAEGDAFINRPIIIDGITYMATAVSMGNPHLVIPVHDLDKLDLENIGPLFEHHRLFPNRINTEFVEVIDRTNIRMRVWERGAGETLACGTGACASLVACALNGLVERKATVHLAGGSLLIEWDNAGIVHMTGPATAVFSGEYLYTDSY